MQQRHPTETLAPAPPRSDMAPAPHVALGVTVATVGTPAWAARHRPPPDPSLRHQPRADPGDQFHETPWPQT
jgi:hypothetical protein